MNNATPYFSIYLLTFITHERTYSPLTDAAAAHLFTHSGLAPLNDEFKQD